MPEDVKSPLMHMEKSGSCVDLSDFSPADVSIEDIAHNLSRIARFNGCTKRPISVAEHSILVFQLIQEWGGGPVVCMQALLHDATEAYIGDVPAPVKAMVPEIKTLESILWDEIATAFNVPLEMDSAIKDADWVALFLEASALCSTDVTQWERYDQFLPAMTAWREQYGDLDDKAMPHPEMIESVFLNLYKSLADAIEQVPTC